MKGKLYGGSLIGKFIFENYYLLTKYIHIIDLIEFVSWYISKETYTSLHQNTNYVHNKLFIWNKNINNPLQFNRREHKNISQQLQNSDYSYKE